MINDLLGSTPKTYPASLLLNFDAFPFVDSSIYNSTISNIEVLGGLGVTTGSAKFGTYSGSFSGSNRFDITVGSEFDFGTGDFTAECWFNPSSVNAEAVLFSMGDPTDGYGIHVGLLQSSYNNNRGPTIRYLIGNGSWAFEGYGDYLDSYNSITLNTWHHVAMTRSSGSLRLYLNGNLIDEIANSTPVTNYNCKISIGGRDNLGQYFIGNIDGLRVTKGVSLYTGTAFTLPNTPPSKNATIAPKLDNHLVMTSTKSSGDITGIITTTTGFYTVNWWDGTKTTYLSGDSFSKAAVGGAQTITIYPSAVTVLLLNFNGANNSTVFTDNSLNNYTVTAYGNTKISTSQSKFGGASAEFNGDGDYLSLPVEAGNLGGGDFTVSFWLYPRSLQSYTVFIGNFATINAGQWQLLMNGNGNIDLFSSGFAGVGQALPTGEWSHVALVRKLGMISIYINGVANGSALNAINYSSTSPLWIGRAPENEANRWFDGYMDDVRIVKGKALYTSNFTPPTSELTSNIGNDLAGFFANADVSNNNLTSVRPFYSSFTHSPGGISPPSFPWIRTRTSPYYYSYWSQSRNRYYGYTGYVPGQFIAGTNYNLNIGYNNLDSSALDQFYTDLLYGSAIINVSDNTGGDSDDPSIATAKGYTVYGSLAPYPVLLLKFNSNYTDSSSQNTSISVLGGSPTFSTSIKKYGSAALSCNGGNVGNDSFVIPDLSQVDYTIEFWIYRPTATAAYEGVINLSNGGSSAGINIHLYTSNEIQFNDGQSAAAYGGTISTGSWYHVACVSKNSVKKLFINGTLVSSATQATPAGPYKIKIGATYGISETTNAYIDDLRIIRGKALYTGDFIVPSSELTTSTSSISAGVTRLLLNFTGENNSTTFTDSSIDARTVTSTNAVISTTQSKPSGGSSGYFNGSSYIESAVVNASKNLILFDDFTVEFWVNPDSDSDFSTGYTLWFGLSSGAGDYLGIKDGSYVAQFGGTGEMFWSGTPSLSTWTHIALVRSRSTVTLYVNGTSLGNKINSTFWLNNTSLNIQIGAFASNFYTKGYIDDFRIVKGKALYTSNFTPPTSQLTNYP